jgi:hypothetical protein
MFTLWSDGTTNLSGTITASSRATTHTANFNTQYLLTTAANPSAGGTVSAGGYYAANSLAPVTATPNASYAFGNWTGSVASATGASTTVTMSAPKTVTANSWCCRR